MGPRNPAAPDQDARKRGCSTNLGALSIAVTSTELGTSGVGCGHSTVGRHGDEVKSTVQTTLFSSVIAFFGGLFEPFFFEICSLTNELADIHVKGEFLVLEVEELVVLVLVVHEVDSGTDVASGLELHAEGAA